MISKTLHYEYKDKEERYIMITGKIEGTLITLMNAHVPPGSDWSFYKYLLGLITAKSQGTFICGGDFNITLNAELDSSNGKGDPRKIGKKINHLMEDIGVTDVWRDINPTKENIPTFHMLIMSTLVWIMFLCLNAIYIEYKIVKLGPVHYLTITQSM